MNDIVRIAMALAIVCAGSVTSVAQEWHKPHEVSVGNFVELQVNDNVNVVYSNNPDSLGKAQFNIANAKADAIMFDYNEKKSILKVQVSPEYGKMQGLPTVYVYSQFVQTVKNSGDSTVRVESMTPCPEFKIITSGNGKIVAPKLHATKVTIEVLTGKGVIVAGGECVTGQYKMVGSGEIIADQLATENANCNIVGTGSIGCTTSGILSVSGLGTGKVYYTGTPKEVKTSKLSNIKAEQVK